MTRREATSKSNCVDARLRFAAKADVAQMGGSHRKMTRREGRLRVILRSRGEVDMIRQRCTDVTRREGTSKSNSVVARRRFAAKANVAQI